jgi:hypothetical protein
MRMKRKFRLPAFFPVLIDGLAAFVTAEQSREGPGLCGQVVRRAVRELEAWLDRYAGFFEFIQDGRADRLLRAIEQLRRELGGR